MFFCSYFICLPTVASSRIVVAQNTNPDRVVATAFQQEPLSVECLNFLFVQQNLARDKTVYHSGTTELVKVHSTYTKIQMPTMDLIRSPLSR